jgi:hypothetical protein
MASVQINIPGIGNVVAENAASEETLQKILTAMQGKGVGGMAGGRGTGNSQDQLKAQEKETEARKKSTKATEDDTKQQSKNNQQSEATSKYMKNLGSSVSTGASQVGNALLGFTSTLAQTAAAVASAFVSSYDQMAENPIGAAATMLSTNIDLAGAAAKAAVDVAAGLGTAAAGILGPFSGVGTGFVNAMSAATKAVIDFATTILKMANEIFAKEFQKSADALKEYTKVGASFAGGMMEMRDIAHDSGMGIKQLTAAAVASSEEIRLMGVTQGEGARIMAQGAKSLATTLGKSGGTMRDELLALGYTYEEQAGLVAQYGATLKASGQDIKNLAPAELAKQTKDYAVNLKVISDITGQDAKKLMDKARSESMRGALMNKLDADQRKAFMSAHATMSTMGPEMQNALMQMIAGGTVTDPMIAGNVEAMEMLKKTAAGVNAGNQDMTADTQRAMSDAAKATQARTKAEGSAVGTAQLMSKGTSGVVSGLADIENKFNNYQLDPDAAEKSKAAALSQSEATDNLTKGYQDLTTQMTGFQNQMEKFATDNLPAYANILAKNAAETMAYFQEALKVAVDFTAYVKGKINEIEGKSTTHAEQEKLRSEYNESTKDGTIMQKYFGANLTPDQQKKKEAYEASVKDNDTSGIETAMQQYARGGITNKRAIFGEAGPEAAVPLPDGRSIPVTFDTGALNKMAASNNDQVMQDLADAIKQLSASMSSGGSTSSPMDAIAKHMEEMKDTVAKQLDYHITMADLMGEQKDISSGILNNSY